MSYKTLVFGCSGTVGLEFINLNKNNNILFYSRTKPKVLKNKFWRYLDLNKNINSIPKKANKIFFFASPHYKLNNLKKKKFIEELYWLKKITKRTKARFFIYLSSGSVHLKKHPVGSVKINCEKYLVNQKKFDYLQIWRPYNLIGIKNFNLSDHFHNVLIKKFFLEKKINYQFYGSANDERGYSHANKFCKLLINKSKLRQSFIYEYGNSNTIKVKNIAKIFKKIFEKKFKKKIKYSFNSKIENINTIKSSKNIKFIDTKENSHVILKKYYFSKIKSYEE
jgi:hypothetical protein